MFDNTDVGKALDCNANKKENKQTYQDDDDDDDNTQIRPMLMLTNGAGNAILAVS